MDVGRDDRTELLLALARGLHQAGLPSDALEDTLRELALTLTVPLEVNAFPTSLIMAVGAPPAQRVIVQRLAPGTVHLRKLALLEGIVGGVRRGRSAADALAEVTALDVVAPPDPPVRTIGGYTLLSTGTALLLGGGSGEVAVAAIAGCAIGAIAAFGQRSSRIDRVFEVSAAFVATVIVGLWERYVSLISLYVALIAGVVQLLPGYSLTTGLTELANRNLVSGSARLGGVFVTLLSLGCGFALGAGLSHNAILNGPTVSPGHTTTGGILGAAVLMAAGIALILHARLQDAGWIVASCVASILLARALPGLGITQATPFVTAFAIGLATNLAARYLRIPQAVVLIPGLLVLVPGSLSYESLLYVFQADPTDAVSLAVRALLAAILIVAGFLTSQLVAPAARRVV